MRIVLPLVLLAVLLVLVGAGLPVKQAWPRLPPEDCA